MREEPGCPGFFLFGRMRSRCKVDNRDVSLKIEARKRKKENWNRPPISEKGDREPSPVSFKLFLIDFAGRVLYT